VIQWTPGFGGRNSRYLSFDDFERLSESVSNEPMCTSGGEVLAGHEDRRKRTFGTKTKGKTLWGVRTLRR